MVAQLLAGVQGLSRRALCTVPQNLTQSVVWGSWQSLAVFMATQERDACISTWNFSPAVNDQQPPYYVWTK